MADIKFETVDIDSIIPYVNNQKKHPEDQIQKIMGSIKEFGVVNPLIVDKDNVLIAGHGRLEALKRLKYDKVPVVRAEHLTPTQIKAYRIADNRLAELSIWDEELLAIDMEELDNIGFDMDIIGFSDTELDELLMSFDGNGADNTEADEIPEVNDEKIVIKKGDLIEIGEHRLLCGDSTDENDVKRLMNDEKVDLIVTDPPYNVAYEGGTKDKLTIKNDNMKDEDFYNFLVSAFANMALVLKEGGGILYLARRHRRFEF